MKFPQWFMKALHWLEMISALAGILLLALGAVSIIIDRPVYATEITSFFHAASSFFLLAIMLFLVIHLREPVK